MTDQFIGEIRAFAGPYYPKGWIACDGLEKPISNYRALYDVIGTAFGGDGRSTFRVPNLVQGQVQVGAGAGPALTPRTIADSGGVAQIALTWDKLPSHTHTLSAMPTPADVASPSAQTMLARSTGGSVFGPPADIVPMAGSVVSTAPTDRLPHDNYMPYLVFVYGICYAIE